jgi:HEAT repeat protein
MTDLQHPMAVARARLDEALVALRTIVDPEVAVRDVESALADAIASIYRAIASFSDYQAWDEHSRLAREALASSLEALQRTETDDPAVDAVLARIAGVLRLLGAPTALPLEALLDLPRRDPGLTVQAVVGVPALVVMSRAVLRPSIPLGPNDDGEGDPGEADEDLERTTIETPPPPEDIASLMAEARDAVATDDADEDEVPPEAPPAKPPAARPDPNDALFGTPVPYGDVVHDRARNCLEDLAAMGAMRRPTPDEAWWCPRTEERLLARLDALVACGSEALPAMVKLLEERPLPDPELTWANLFLFGSIAGDDALHAVQRVIGCVDLTAPGMTFAVADALSHAPHPGVVALVHPWLEHADAPFRVVAVTVLSRRDALGWEALEARLQDGDLDVRRAAARSLARRASPPPLAVFEKLLRDDDGEVVRAAMRASVLHRNDAGVRRAVEVVREPGGASGDAAMVIAVSLAGEGFGLLLHGVQTDTRPASVEALGWYGHLGAAQILIALLAHEDKEVQKAAALALWRLTGAPLTDDRPDPGYSDENPAWTGTFRAPERAAKLTGDPAVWSQWWQKHGGRADTSKRHRFGHPWSVEDDLWEWEDHASSPVARGWCHLELVARTGRSLPFDMDAFIPTQEAQMAAWRAHLASRRASQPAGAWVTTPGEGAFRP